MYTKHNCDLASDTWAICIGGSAHSFAPFEFLEEQLGRPVQRDEPRLRRRQRHVALVETQSLLPGVQEYVLTAKRLGLKLGVASSSSHEWVDNHLHRLGVLPYFDSLKCSNDVKYSKPAPDLHLAAPH